MCLDKIREKKDCGLERGQLGSKESYKVSVTEIISICLTTMEGNYTYIPYIWFHGRGGDVSGDVVVE